MPEDLLETTAWARRAGGTNGWGAGEEFPSAPNGLWVFIALATICEPSLLTSCIRSILSPNTLSTQLRKGFPFMSLLRIEAYVSVTLMGGKTSGCRDRAWGEGVGGRQTQFRTPG